MTTKELLEKIVEGKINYFFSLDECSSTIIKAHTLINVDEEGRIFFKAAEIFSAVCIFTEDNKLMSETAWHRYDKVYLDKNEEVFESLSELQSSKYYKETLIKFLYKRL